MPPPDTAAPAAEPVDPAKALRQWAKEERQLTNWANLHWADSAEGAIVIDLIPNPKKYIVGQAFGVKVAMDCGEPGVHVGR